MIPFRIPDEKVLASLRETTGATQAKADESASLDEGAPSGDEPPAYNDEQVAQWLADAGDDGDGPVIVPAAIAVAITPTKPVEKVLPPLEDVVARLPAETIQLIEEEFQVRFREVKWFRSDKLA